MHIASQLKNTMVTVGFAQESSNKWTRTKYSRDNAGVALAVEYVVRNGLQYTCIVAVRLGLHVRNFTKSGNGIKRTVLLWWTDKVEQSQVFESDTNSHINTPKHVGAGWDT